MNYFQILCILLSAVLIYLLTKLIIEKNENAISMTKILGYENKEIASLSAFHNDHGCDRRCGQCCTWNVCYESGMEGDLV